MNKQAIQFTSRHTPRFSEIDPYGHMNSQHYVAYFLEHRFIGMRERLSWDLKTIAGLPQLFFIKNIEVNFVRPVKSEESFIIVSQVESFEEKTAKVVMTMSSDQEILFAKCQTTIACIDAKTQKLVTWCPTILEKFFEVDDEK